MKIRMKFEAVVYVDETRCQNINEVLETMEIDNFEMLDENGRNAFAGMEPEDLREVIIEKVAELSEGA
jgi:hypothetical protein